MAYFSAEFLIGPQLNNNLLNLGIQKEAEEALKRFGIKSLGDILVVGLNTDHSVRNLKGDGRPIKTEKERANILSAVKFIDYMVLFNEETPEKLIREIRPDILVKGDDYKIDEVVGREIVEGYGAHVELIPILKGHSTTMTLEKIIANHRSSDVSNGE